MYLRPRALPLVCRVQSVHHATACDSRLATEVVGAKASPMSASPLPNELPEPQDFVAQMRPALLKYFRRKSGCAAESEDLVQDVLTRALTHATWKSPAEARGYIFRMAVNRWRDRCRRQRTHGIVLEWNENTGGEAGAENPPERVLMAREEISQLDQALRELNARTRAVLVLVRVEKVKIAMVAEMLGISVSAVNKHLARGLAHLARVRNRQEGS